MKFTTKLKLRDAGFDIGDFISENKITLGVVLLIGCTGLYGYHNSANVLNGIDKSYFTTNAFGIPLTAKIGPDAVKVAVSESFTEEQKNHIQEAIEELDFDLDGVKYEIILNETSASPVSDLNCIHIGKTNKLSHDMQENSGKQYNGLTTMVHNPLTGKIIYPVDINLHVESMEETAEMRADTTEYYDKDGKVNIDNGKSHSEYYNEALKEVVKRVVKHEMLHTLGLVDQYSEDMETKTIMYGYDSYDAPIDLTELDKHNLNTVYTAQIDNKQVKISSTVELPKEVNIPKKIASKLVSDNLEK